MQDAKTSRTTTCHALVLPFLCRYIHGRKTMEEILVLILQCVAELLLQALGSGALDFMTWSWDGGDSGVSRGCLLGILLFVAGGILGGLSLLVLTHHLLPYGWMRMANLVMGPACSGWASWFLVRWRKSRYSDADPGSHGLGAALACLGFVLVRFTWGIR